MASKNLSTAMGESMDVPGGSDQRKSENSWNKGSSRTQISSALYNFEGLKAEIGGVLGLKHEKMKNKVIFDDFIDKGYF